MRVVTPRTSTAAAASQARPAAGVIVALSPPAAATISGDGVSPAASAAARGSPPGSDADTRIAEAGRRAGSLSRQRTIASSIAGSSVFTIVVGAVNAPDWCRSISSLSVFASKARRPVKIS